MILDHHYNQETTQQTENQYMDIDGRQMYSYDFNFNFYNDN